MPGEQGGDSALGIGAVLGEQLGRLGVPAQQGKAGDDGSNGGDGRGGGRVSPLARNALIPFLLSRRTAPYRSAKSRATAASCAGDSAAWCAAIRPHRHSAA